jgi:RHS repeat-associated protein
MLYIRSYQNLSKVIISLVLLTWASSTKCQIKPDASIRGVPTATGNTIPNKPADYTGGIPVNYIRVWQPQFPDSDQAYIGSSSRVVSEVNISTQYFDGLGRPLQTVSWQASPAKQDVVSPAVYDAYGREQYKFLPYTSPTASASGKPGQFKVNPFTEQNNFYTVTYKTEQPAYTNENYFYSKTNFEPSPLNRILDSYAPGNSWAGSELLNTNAASEKKVSMQYRVNNTADAVRIWTITFNTTIADYTNIPTTTSIYNAGTLYKTVTVDEAGNSMVEYKDQEDHVILKKVQIGNIATDFSGYSGFLCTYYIYDDLGQLRTVLQPKAVAAMVSSGNWVLDQNTVNELCFRYEYDFRQRISAKKVPGAAWIYMVYDIRNRLAFSQDGNLGVKSQWMYTLYDDLNRPVQTGIMYYTGTWSALQASMPTSSSSSTITNSGTSVTVNLPDMYINSRENGRTLYQATNSIVFDNGFTSEDGASITAQINTEAAVNFNDNVSVNTYAIPPGATLYPLTYTYYDEYSATAKTYNTANNSKLDDGGNPFPDALPSQNSTQTRGMVTVSKTRVIEDPNNLTTGKWLETASFYDDRGRSIQAQTTNYKGGQDVVTSRYDFTNKVVSSYIVHNNASGNVNNLRVLTSIKYDHEARLLTSTKTINDDATNNKRVITSNIYDALGLLKEKQTGQKSSTDVIPLEDDNYNYNIRGWLKDINWYGGSTYASQMSINSNKWFSMDLSYDWGFDNGSGQYNGNMSGTRWKAAGDGQERAYGFKYDAANRLLKADFTRNNSGWITDPVIDFSMKMGDGLNASSAYDENGNIKAMTQTGILGLSKGLVDILTYFYSYNGSATNKLSGVSDQVTTDNKLGDFTDNHTGDNDYGYDPNGNLITDLNKRLNGSTGTALTSGGAITYNFLNLPSVINVKNADGSSKGTITYIYDAIGTKLEKRTNETALSKQTNTTYLSGFVYENNILQFFSHEEGRIRYKANNNAYVYDYFLKDHLGNTRTVLTEETSINYYPAATLEGAFDGSSNTMGNYESKFYNINSAYITPETSIPSWGTETSANTKLYYNNNGNPPSNLSYPAGCTPLQTDGSSKLYKLNATTNKTGLEFMIHVMAGDHVDIFGKSYYLNTATISNGNSTTLDLLSLMSNFLLAPSNAALGKGITAAQLNSSNAGIFPNSTFFRGNNNETGNTVPKAYINYIFLDEQFKFVSGNASRVGVSGMVKDHWYVNAQLQNIAVPKNGYIFVYVSNESNFDVFFDNLQVIHKPGPLMEETSYYPFGLTMAGISSSAAGVLKNKYKFGGKELNSNEFSDNSGLELYDFSARNYDPQIGRFWSGDAKADKLVQWSPYSYAVNNPILFVDPDGKFPYPIHVRSFAPWSSFGLGYSGDNRGYSTALGKRFEGGTATSRIQQTFTVDPTAGTYKGLQTWSDQSHSFYGTKTGEPKGNIKDFTSSTDKSGNSTTSFTSVYAGNNPLVPGSSDIDVKTKFSLTENIKAGTLNITATQTGDAYPAAETFIGDTKGNQLFIGVSPAAGGDVAQSLGPYKELPGDNSRPMMSSSFTVTIDKNGVFTGVKQGDKTYGIGDWNKMMQAKPLVKEDDKPFPPR